jgi:hypothetical protein
LFEEIQEYADDAYGAQEKEVQHDDIEFEEEVHLGGIECEEEVQLGGNEFEEDLGSPLNKRRAHMFY